jgi:hypothetical protein
MNSRSLEDQRRFSDQDFWQTLDLNYKPLLQVRAALKAGDEAKAKSCLIHYFRNRRKPTITQFRTDNHWSDWGELTIEKRADLLCRNRIAETARKVVDANGGSEKSGGIDWQKALTATHTILRQGAMATLTCAWEQTGKKKYALALQRWIESYVKGVPFVLAEGFHKEDFFLFGGVGHEQLNGCYLIFVWADILNSKLMRTEGVLSDDFWFLFIKNFRFLASQFSRFLGATWRADNHHLMERGTVPFFLGVQFPEFRLAAKMEDYGRKMILRHFDYNVLADHVGSEHCTSYQYRCFIRYALPDSVGLCNGRDLLGKQRREKLKDWLEFQGYITAPDGRQPDLGDGAGPTLDSIIEESGALYRSSVLKGISRSLEIKSKVNPAFEKGWQATSSKPPRQTSRIYPYGGHLVLRDAWSRKANFLWMGIKNRSLYDAHTHWDIFDFVLCAHGRRFLGDPNGRSKLKKNSPGRGYYFSMDAHNCLIIDDDILTSYRALQKHWGRQPPRIISAETCFADEVDYATFVHDGYRPLLHRRDVLLVRGRYVLMTDGITMDFTGFNALAGLEGDIRPHHYKQRLHFETGISVRKGKAHGSLVTDLKSGPNLLVVPEPFENLKASIEPDSFLQEGSNAELRGCKIGDIERQTMGACFFSTIYRPFVGSRAPGVKVSSLTPKRTPYRNDHHHAVLIRDGAYTDLWFVQRNKNRPTKTMVEGDGCRLETDAASVFISRKNGKVVTAFRIGGSFVRLNGRSVASRSRKLTVHRW